MNTAFGGIRRHTKRSVRFLVAIGIALTAVAGMVGLAGNSYAQEEFWDLPRAEYDPGESGTQTIVLAGGCFWGIQGVYQYINGVSSAVSGYAGGEADTATYSRVLSGSTGHAESVQITYDPQVISLGEVLRVFFSVAHDPTTLNRQGSDIGPHYRSHIYTTTSQQADVVNSYIRQLDDAQIYGRSIVTRVDAAPEFFAAEPYHQDYLVDRGANDPNGPNIRYLQYWDFPKITNTQRVFPEYWRDDPVLVAESNPNLAP